MSTISDAIVNGNEQIAILKFNGDVCLDNSDIASNPGITINDYFCAEENLSIGLCPSSSLTAKILNPDSVVTRDIFTPFLLKFGVRTSATNRTDNYRYSVTFGGKSLVVNSSSPYLVYDGVTVSVQGPVTALFGYGTELYAIRSNGDAVKFNLNGGSLIEDSSYTTSDFAKNKWAGWSKAVIIGDNTCIIQMTGTTEEYALCDMGVFNPDIPKKVNVKSIDLTAYDNMSLLDKDASSWWAGLTYPLTLQQIFTSLCTSVGVSYDSSSFPNSTVSYSSAPAVVEETTYREILKHIAEAGCSIARCTPTGAIKLDWFASATNPFNYHYSQDITEVAVQPIDKVQAKNSEDDIGTIVGSGTNCYTILNNMFIVGSTAQMTAMVTEIYNRLSAFSSYYPSSTVMDCDWEIRSGSIITETISIPIFTQTIVWNSRARTTIEATGEEVQSVNNATNRALYQMGTKMTEIKTDVDGIETRVTGAEGNISTLEQTASGLTVTVSGLKSAQDATKLTFDSSGLTVKNGGFKIKNASNADVFYADVNGNLNIVGDLNTKKETVSGSVWETLVRGTGITIEKDDTVVGYFGRNSDDSLSMLYARDISIRPYGSSSSFVRLWHDGTAGGQITVRSTAIKDMVRCGCSTNGASYLNLYAQATDASVVRLTGNSDGGSVYITNGSASYTMAGLYTENNSYGVLLLGSGTTTGAILTPTGETAIKYMSSGSHDFVNRYNSAYANIYCNSVIQTSDKHLKKNFEDISVEQASRFVHGLKPQTFRFKDETDGKHWGFIAQDIKELADEIGEEFSGYQEKPFGETVTCSLAYSELIAPLVRVVQDQEKRIKELEKKI